MPLQPRDRADIITHDEASSVTDGEPANNYREECLSFVRSTVAKATRPMVILTESDILHADLSERLPPQLVELVDNIRDVLNVVKDLEDESRRLKTVERKK